MNIHGESDSRSNFKNKGFKKSSSLNSTYRERPLLTGKDLPYDFKIQMDMKRVYYIKQDGSLRRANSIFMKRSGILSISIDDITIHVKSYDAEKKKYNYEVIDNV